MKLIDKDALVVEIEKRIEEYKSMKIDSSYYDGMIASLEFLRNEFIDTLEVKDPYEQLIQYPTREDGIKAHAEDYSWNIESELFQQLTPEQQKLWRKEIEQACISGGYSGLNLAKDPRYKENLEVKEVDDELQGIEKEVAEGFVEMINKKRIPISLKGEKKAKFKNEFNTLWQVVDGIQFANVAKYIIERLCLHFAAWGSYNLKGIGQIDKDDKKKNGC